MDPALALAIEAVEVVAEGLSKAFAPGAHMSEIGATVLESADKLRELAQNAREENDG